MTPKRSIGQRVGQGLAAACVATALGTAAWAQAPPDAGSTLRDQQVPQWALPRPAPAIQVDVPQRPPLRPTELTRLALKRWRISGNTVFDDAELQRVVQDYLGQQVGFDDLTAAAARISGHYRERGYLVARAYLPAQTVQDGVVEIAVLEGHFGSIRLNNRSLLSDRVLGGYLRGLRGVLVTAGPLERRLLLLNDLAGVGDARANLSAGAAVGETDLTLDVNPARRLLVSVEYDNHGNRFTGSSRVSGRVNLFSPLGLGDALKAAYTAGLGGMAHGSLGYRLPVGNDGLALGADFSTSHYQLGQDFASLDASGGSDTQALSASYPLVRSPAFNLNAHLAHDWRKLVDRVESIGTVVDKASRTLTLVVAGDIGQVGPGQGFSAFSIGYAHGELDLQSPAALTIDKLGAGTAGRFGKWNVNLLHLQPLGDRLMLRLALALQKADKNLDSSEKFTLGGAHGVRAYAQGEASGDSGYLATLELQYARAADPGPGRIEPFMFLDIGAVAINARPFTAGDNRRALAAGGAGLRWMPASGVEVAMMVATRLDHQQKEPWQPASQTRGWIQIIRHF